MLFMVEFRLKPGLKNKVVDVFELRGPNRYPGVAFRGAWVASREDLVYVLGESTDQALVTAACEVWREHGEFTIRPVVDIESF